MKGRRAPPLPPRLSRRSLKLFHKPSAWDRQDPRRFLRDIPRSFPLFREISRQIPFL